MKQINIQKFNYLIKHVLSIFFFFLRRKLEPLFDLIEALATLWIENVEENVGRGSTGRKPWQVHPHQFLQGQSSSSGSVTWICFLLLP